MPTAKPRVQVALTIPQYELLARLAKLQSRSMSSLIAELFEQVYPVLERVAVVLQAAVRAQDSMRQGLRESTDRAERELAPHVAAAMGQLDLLATEFEGAAKPAPEAARSAAMGVADPRPVTRGSGFGPPGGKHTKSPKRAPKRPISLLRRTKSKKRVSA